MAKIDFGEPVEDENATPQHQDTFSLPRFAAPASGQFSYAKTFFMNLSCYKGIFNRVDGSNCTYFTGKTLQP